MRRINRGFGALPQATNKAMASVTAGGAGVTPDAETLNAYNVTVPGMKAGRVQVLYDSLTLTNGAVGEFNFFTSPIGSSNKTLADTNMRQQGQLPAGVSHFTTGISARILPTAATFADRLADLRAVGEAGYFQFNIVDVERYVSAPFSAIPARVQLSGAVAMHSAAVDPAADIGFAAFDGEPIDFTPFRIEAGQSFNGVLNYKTALALSANVKVFVYLHGLIINPVT